MEQFWQERSITQYLLRENGFLVIFTTIFCFTLPHLAIQQSFERTNPLRQGYQIHFHPGHISLVVAFKGPNVILGLFKCNYSLTRGKELGAAAGQKQGAGLDKTRWRAGFGLQALCLPPVKQTNPPSYFKVQENMMKKPS